MKRKMIHYTATFLHECGIEIIQQDTISEKPTGYRKLWRIITMGTFFTMIIVCSIIYSILHRDDFYEAISTMPFFAATFTSMSAVFTVFQFRKKLSKILYRMDDNMYTYPDEHLIDIKYQWYLREDNIVILMNIMLSLHYITVTTITIPGFVELFFNGKIETFLYPSWSPWRIEDGVNSQLLTFLFQFSTLLCGGTINMINVLTSYVTFFEFVRQYKRLNAAIESLKRRTLAKIRSDKITDENYSRILRANIVHCIRHYRIQNENLEVFETWFSEYFSYELAVYVLSFAFGLFITMHAPSLEKVINQLTMILYTNFSILIKCIVGDVLVDLNEDFASTIFSHTEWYDFDEDNRKLIRTFHLLVQRRRQNIKGFSIFKANRVTFAEVIRSAHSLFNVINLSMKDQ